MTTDESKSHSHQQSGGSGEPLVSIGVPVYNGGKFLRECLESILGQTYRNWECVILDNNSTDDTNSIARQFAEADQRFRLHRNEELLPLMDNWNRVHVLSNKDAKYFKIVPADDWLFPDYLKEILELMESNPEVGVGSSYRLDGTRVRGKGMDYYKGQIFDGKWVINRELSVCIDVTGSANTVLYRASLLRSVKGYPFIYNPDSLHGDTELTYNLLYGSSFGFVYKVLSYTRRHDESITSEIANKVNSQICFRDNQLVKYSDIVDNFEKKYTEHRIHYSLLMLKKLVRFQRGTLRWQNRNLVNKLSALEIMKALVLYLPFYKYRRPCSD